MTPKVKVENPLKYFNLYKNDELLYIGECRSITEFLMEVNKTFPDIDLNDNIYYIETREKEVAENQGWE